MGDSMSYAADMARDAFENTPDYIANKARVEQFNTLLEKSLALQVVPLTVGDLTFLLKHSLKKKVRYFPEYGDRISIQELERLRDIVGS